MVATVDGRAAIDGRTRGARLATTDTLLLTELRALADAVLIGAGTLRAEGYGRLVGNPERVARREPPAGRRRPTAVLLSRGLDLPWDAGLFAAARPARARLHRARSATPPEVAAPRRGRAARRPQPAAALRDLRARGIRALLCEGGPTLNRALLAAGLVDELFLTLSPLLAGNKDAPRIVEGDDLPAPVRADARVGAAPR